MGFGRSIEATKRNMGKRYRQKWAKKARKDGKRSREKWAKSPNKWTRPRDVRIGEPGVRMTTNGQTNRAIFDETDGRKPSTTHRWCFISQVIG